MLAGQVRDDMPPPCHKSLDRPTSRTRSFKPSPVWHSPPGLACTVAIGRNCPLLSLQRGLITARQRLVRRFDLRTRCAPATQLCLSEATPACQQLPARLLDLGLLIGIIPLHSHKTTSASFLRKLVPHTAKANPLILQSPKPFEPSCVRPSVIDESKDPHGGCWCPICEISSLLLESVSYVGRYATIDTGSEVAGMNPNLRARHARNTEQAFLEGTTGEQSSIVSARVVAGHGHPTTRQMKPLVASTSPPWPE